MRKVCVQPQLSSSAKHNQGGSVAGALLHARVRLLQRSTLSIGIGILEGSENPNLVVAHEWGGGM
jgi:hypothetical protein